MNVQTATTSSPRALIMRAALIGLLVEAMLMPASNPAPEADFTMGEFSWMCRQLQTLEMPIDEYGSVPYK